MCGEGGGSDGLDGAVGWRENHSWSRNALRVSSQGLRSQTGRLGKTQSQMHRHCCLSLILHYCFFFLYITSCMCVCMHQSRPFPLLHVYKYQTVKCSHFHFLTTLVRVYSCNLSKGLSFFSLYKRALLEKQPINHMHFLHKFSAIIRSKSSCRQRRKHFSLRGGLFSTLN